MLGLAVFPIISKNVDVGRDLIDLTEEMSVHGQVQVFNFFKIVVTAHTRVKVSEYLRETFMARSLLPRNLPPRIFQNP